MECTIIKAWDTEVEVRFSEDVQPLLEEKGLWPKTELWVIQSPPDTKITSSHTYNSQNKTATIHLDSQLKEGEWVRFMLIEDVILWEKTIITQAFARVSPNENQDGKKDWEPKLDNAIRAVQDLSSYPFPVTDATPVQTTSGDISGTTSLNRLVDSAMKTALGRVPKAEDTRSFLGALNQSFKLSEMEGHTVVDWTPHALSGTTDLGGGVTGAQASLAAFGQNALKATLPLIDGLYSLLPDPDPEEVEAARSILRAQWTELVAELGIEGGPREPRVKQLFDTILGIHLVKFGKELGMIKIGSNGEPLRGDPGPFMLSRQHVITADEEQDLTDFIALKDYILAVGNSWFSYQQSRQGEDKDDLGTGLVLLARALSVVTEQTAEVYAAMDSVYVGTAERQVIWLTFDDNSMMTVEELMSWVNTFASEEAPRLIQSGGLRGVEAIEPIAKTLSDRVQQFIHAKGLPDGLRQRRVHNPLHELHKYLDQVVDQAQRISPNGSFRKLNGSVEKVVGTGNGKSKETGPLPMTS